MRIELTPQRRRVFWLLPLTLALVVIAFTIKMVNASVPSIERSAINLLAVESGNLDIYTTVFGELASAQEQLLTAPAQGKVASILIRPGAQVQPDSVILVLANPLLEQQVHAANGELAQLQAQLAAFKYEQQNARLNFESSIAAIQADLERAQLDLSVNQDLLELGVGLKLELRRAELAVKQQQQKLELEQKKYQQFVEMQGFQLTQRQITIEQQQSKLSLLEKQLADMQVKAGIAGRVQSLTVELGESVNLGQSLAKVGSDRQLIARLRLPQHQADQIDLDSPVTINTMKGYIEGKISRIESVVNNGMVLAEAQLTGELPSNARPALAVTGRLFLRHQTQALYVKQQPGFRPMSKKSVFVQTDDKVLHRRDVTFAELSEPYLIVTDGLQPGDRIVTTQLQQYDHVDQLAISQ